MQFTDQLRSRRARGRAVCDAIARCRWECSESPNTTHFSFYRKLMIDQIDQKIPGFTRPGRAEQSRAACRCTCRVWAPGGDSEAAQNRSSATETLFCCLKNIQYSTTATFYRLIAHCLQKELPPPSFSPTNSFSGSLTNISPLKWTRRTFDLQSLNSCRNTFPQQHMQKYMAAGLEGERAGGGVKNGMEGRDAIEEEGKRSVFCGAWRLEPRYR